MKSTMDELYDENRLPCFYYVRRRYAKVDLAQFDQIFGSSYNQIFPVKFLQLEEFESRTHWQASLRRSVYNEFTDQFKIYNPEAEKRFDDSIQHTEESPSEDENNFGMAYSRFLWGEIKDLGLFDQYGIDHQPDHNFVWRFCGEVSPLIRRKYWISQKPVPAMGNESDLPGDWDGFCNVDFYLADDPPQLIRIKNWVHH